VSGKEEKEGEISKKVCTELQIVEMSEMVDSPFDIIVTMSYRNSKKKTTSCTVK